MRLKFEGVLVMKAWYVREKDNFLATVVFADTRGKAKVLAMSTEECEYADFLDIEAYRVPVMDKYYQSGKTQMYWNMQKDRLALVKDLEFACSEEYFDSSECENCWSKEYCYLYQFKKEQQEAIE